MFSNNKQINNKIKFFFENISFRNFFFELTSPKIMLPQSCSLNFQYLNKKFIAFSDKICRKVHFSIFVSFHISIFGQKNLTTDICGQKKSFRVIYNDILHEISWFNRCRIRRPFRNLCGRARFLYKIVYTLLY